MKMKCAIAVCLFALLIVSACNNNSQHESAEGNTAQHFFADSLYKFKNYTGLINIQKFNFDKGGFVKADSNFKKQFINPLEFYGDGRFVDVYPLYDCYFFAKQPKVGNIQPVIVHVTMDDYTSYIMLLIDEEHKLTDWKEIAGGICGGPTELEDGLELCVDAYSVFEKENMFNHFRITTTLPIIDSLPSDSVNIIDSLIYKVEVENTGSLKETLVDSVRFQKILKP